MMLLLITEVALTSIITCTDFWKGRESSFYFLGLNIGKYVYCWKLEVKSTKDFLSQKKK